MAIDDVWIIATCRDYQDLLEVLRVRRGNNGLELDFDVGMGLFELGSKPLIELDFIRFALPYHPNRDRLRLGGRT